MSRAPARAASIMMARVCFPGCGADLQVCLRIVAHVSRPQEADLEVRTTIPISGAAVLPRVKPKLARHLRLGGAE
jgi:hypothetical protein